MLIKAYLQEVTGICKENGLKVEEIETPVFDWCFLIFGSDSKHSF